MLEGRLEVAGIEDESCSTLGPRFQHGGFITGAAESSNEWWPDAGVRGTRKESPFLSTEMN